MANMAVSQEQKWVYNQDGHIVCDCGEDPQTMQHLPEYPLLPDPFSPYDLAVYRVLQWRGIL